MRRVFIYCILIVMVNLPSAGQILRFSGDRLVLVKDRRISLIKEYKDCSRLEGYAMIDSVNIFLAEQDETTSEAVTTLSSYDSRSKKVTRLGMLGETGKSCFDYQHETDWVVFNWYDGIYIFKLHDKHRDPKVFMKPKKVLDCSDLFIPFWIDKNTIGYLTEEDGNPVTRFVTVE